MRYGNSLSVGLVACLLSGAAWAQVPPTTGPQNRGPAACGLQQPLRIESPMSFQMPSEGSVDSDRQRQQTEAARKSLYEMTAQECRLLTEVFKGECRLVAIRVNTSAGMRGGSGEILNVNGQASYELTPRP